jgi:hypothetical protein
MLSIDVTISAPFGPCLAMSGTSPGDSPLADRRGPTNCATGSRRTSGSFSASTTTTRTYWIALPAPGQPGSACAHLVDAPMPAYGPRHATIDWMCEGVGLLCRDCVVMHLSDERTPHRDPRCASSAGSRMQADAAHEGLRGRLVGAWLGVRQAGRSGRPERQALLNGVVVDAQLPAVAGRRDARERLDPRLQCRPRAWTGGSSPC